MRKERKEKIINILVNSVGVVLFLIISAVVTVALWPYVSEFLSSPEKLQSFVSENGVFAVPLYLLLQVLQVVVALIPGEALEIGAGAAFGWFWGLILAEIGVSLGTIVIFLVSRKLGRRFVDALVGEKKLKIFDKLNGHPRRDSVIFLVFLIPGLPKDLLTYAAAFFDISMWKFIVMTAIARIPSIITSTLAADMIVEGNYLTAALIFLATGAAAVICFLLSEKIMAKIGVNKSEE